MMSCAPKSTAVLVLGLVVAWSVAQSAHAQSGSPMLHEYIAPQAAEDVKLESTNPSGQLPAAVRTPSGTITPPDTTTTPEPRRIYHEGSDRTPGFKPDRDTRRPEVEHYDDPFSPTLTPFKRMHAYDAVRPDYTLVVRDTQYRPITIGGTPRDGDDRFFGDMVVQLRAGDRVRIPSVGPGARLLELVSSPRTEVTVWRDGADNWFVYGDQSARVRLISHLAIAREAFASEFADVTWGSLPRVPVQPAAHSRAFRRVAKAIDISRTTMSPRDVVLKMVSYFRSFAPSK
ncbi:MAG: transglutaminase domain-containing protein, partial [Deltaproteobacteria bacterium]